MKGGETAARKMEAGEGTQSRRRHGGFYAMAKRFSDYTGRIEASVAREEHPAKGGGAEGEEGKSARAEEGKKEKRSEKHVTKEDGERGERGNTSPRSVRRI